MNTEDLNFAYKVRHALNEKLDDLPAATSDRLAAARQAALARKKAHVPVRVVRSAPAVAGGGHGFFANPLGWFNRFSVALPLMLLVGGLMGVFQYEQQQSIAELAELDAAVLSDELPLSAYLDDGFHAYLETRGQ